MNTQAGEMVVFFTEILMIRIIYLHAPAPSIRDTCNLWHFVRPTEAIVANFPCSCHAIFQKEVPVSNSKKKKPHLPSHANCHSFFFHSNR